MFRWLLTTALLFAAQLSDASDWLFRNGRSDYKIVVSDSAHDSEKAAARELQDYIRQISGVLLPITSKPENGGKHVFIGLSDYSKKLLDVEMQADPAETFTYQTKDGNLFIYGGRNVGTAYGVFSFLEQQLGVHWYSSDFTMIPRLDAFKLGKLKHTESPAFRYRHVLYYQMVWNALMNVHNLQNMHLWPMDCGSYGTLFSFWETHTFSLLLPPDEFFSAHPEYYSLHKGRRIDNGQLCLSNPVVLGLLAERMLEVIKKNPKYFAYSLSQNDNQLYCECETCCSLEQRYGSHAGLLLWAVNQVAEAIDKKLPGTKLITLAYQYTRQAPKGILPHRNVFIRLCDIECCFLHPIDRSKENDAFMSDLKEWSKLTDRLFIFDYVTNFTQYTAPFPNFMVMASNLQTFAKYHVAGVMEEGQYESNGGEWAELKQWVLAKLLWNPRQDVNQLVRQFIRDYYGKAAPHVLKYYSLCCSLVHGDTHARFDNHHSNKLYTDLFVDKGISLLQDALAECKTDSAVTRRVEHLLLQPLYLQMMRQPLKAAANGNIKRYINIVNRDKIRMREGVPSEVTLREHGFT